MILLETSLVMTEPKRQITARLVRLGEEEKAFDREFWRQAGHEARFEAAWQMVLDYLAIRGLDESHARFDRTVVCLKRRKG
jgi:hypothetical protein